MAKAKWYHSDHHKCALNAALLISHNFKGPPSAQFYRQFYSPLRNFTGNFTALCAISQDSPPLQPAQWQSLVPPNMLIHALVEAPMGSPLKRSILGQVPQVKLTAAVPGLSESVIIQDCSLFHFPSPDSPLPEWVFGPELQKHGTCLSKDITHSRLRSIRVR